MYDRHEYARQRLCTNTMATTALAVSLQYDIYVCHDLHGKLYVESSVKTQSSQKLSICQGEGETHLKQSPVDGKEVESLTDGL